MSSAVINRLAFLLPALFLFYVFLRVFYNLFLHPLRSFPGPFAARATILASQRHTLKGEFPYWLHELHLKYGSIVRFAPDELSVIDSAVWKDVYGHRTTKLFTKQESFYGPDYYGNPAGMIRADNESHAKQRKLVSHAFSDKALKEQEQILKEYAKLLVKSLTAASEQHGEVDMVRFYNYTTFDIMADLTFGEPLGLLQGSTYIPWVAALFGSIKFLSVTGVVRRWPLLDNLLQRYLPKRLKEKRREHLQFSSARVDKRMQKKTDRPDIWTYVTKEGKDENGETTGLLPSQLHSNASTFMTAGTETTATELSGITYYLYQQPEKLSRLKKEVRDAFASVDDMTMTKLSQLEYLNACIEEGLRVYPPLAGITPRNTPSTGANVAGRWIPGGTIISIAHYAAYHSPANFRNPDSFVPERWLPEGQQEYGSDNKEVFNAFSYGPRNCLGKNLAYHEMRLVLATVMFSFDIELIKGAGDWVRQECHILWAKPAMMARVTPVSS
ncbi:cytochrome P450 [Karstenula rhodostoma CBS 690.94]|uniref:Cytochrome P450 n=1 Tax=Karstenula rhodostoma CBS 690.94 TaxID=1392251 RepID=A0A9P4PK33_9PLEO|nr:cytochrome P450 [Karstenula rhodostoma CBS 690.94]